MLDKPQGGAAMRINKSIQTIRDMFSNFTGGYDNADTMHNIYEDFGYPQALDFNHYWNMYRRFGVAKAVVELPVDLTWVDAPVVKSDNKILQDDFLTLATDTRLWSRLKGLDKRQRVGRYAGLFIQVRDGKKPETPVGKLNGVKSIARLIPMYEGQLEVTETDNDPMSDKFGQPKMYQFNSMGTGGRNERGGVSFSIHPDRLIMAAEGADDGSIYGISALECIYNDLMDLRKVSGAGGEGFYQNTRSAPVFTAKDDFGEEENEEELAEAIDDWLSKHRKRLVLRGIEAKFPNIQLSDPKDFYQNSINNIAAGSNIPSAFLIGQQTGRLASDKDSRHLMTTAQARRDVFLKFLIGDVIDWFIAKAVLPAAEYVIEWGDLLTLSDMEKAEVVAKMAETNERQFRSGMTPVYMESEMRERAGMEAISFDIDRDVEPEPEETETDDQDQPE